MKDNGAPSNNRLNARQKFELWNSLKEITTEVLQERPTRTKLALRMQKQLGFKVTESNIRDAVVQGIIPEWTSKQGAKIKEGQSKIKRLEGLERAVKRICSDLGLDFAAISIGPVEPAAPDNTAWPT